MKLRSSTANQKLRRISISFCNVKYRISPSHDTEQFRTPWSTFCWSGNQSSQTQLSVWNLAFSRSPNSIQSVFPLPMKFSMSECGNHSIACVCLMVFLWWFHHSTHSTNSIRLRDSLGIFRFQWSGAWLNWSNIHSLQWTPTCVIQERIETCFGCRGKCTLREELSAKKEFRDIQIELVVVRSRCMKECVNYCEHQLS
jgi:hypothetical protein